MFGRATIRLGIGPHSSFALSRENLTQMTLNFTAPNFFIAAVFVYIIV